MRLRFLVAIAVPAVAILAFAFLASAASGASTAVSCTLWASPTGDDAASGSSDRPFRTLARLMQGLGPGQTGCLPAGAVFEERLVIGNQGTSAQPVTLITPTGARAVIGEGIEFLQSSRSVIVSRVSARMSGNEPYNSLPAVVQLGGFRNQIVRSEISGGAVEDKSRVCVQIDHGNLVVVDRNLIHRCGIVKANPAIYAPGIRVVTGGSATITNNTIWSTPGDGIVLAPNAQGARVNNNVIDGTTNGIFLSGDARFTSNRNKVTQNIITFVAGYAAHGSNPTGKPVGIQNIVTKNCVWQPGRGLFAGSGFTAPANRVLDPLFTNRPATFALKRTSPCWNQRPLP